MIESWLLMRCHAVYGIAIGTLNCLNGGLVDFGEMGSDELQLLRRPEILIGVVEVDGSDGANGRDEKQEENKSGDDWGAASSSLS